MFQAILKGKIRGLPDKTGLLHGLDWRNLVGQTEDFLTAAVFSRLSYLPALTMWEIIRTSAVAVTPDAILPEQAGLLIAHPEFWPRWRLKFVHHQDEIEVRDESLEKEPDVFIQFERLTLIVEAKRYDGKGQNPEQWAAEMAACLQLGSENRGTSQPVWLLAVGGIEDARVVYGAALETFQKCYGYRDRPLLVAASSWSSLSAKIVEAARKHSSVSHAARDGRVTVAGDGRAAGQEKCRELEPGLNNIIDDLRGILDFYGFRNTRWATELASLGVAAVRPIEDRALRVLGRASERASAPVVRHITWCDRASPLRGIHGGSLEIMGRARK